MYNKLIKKLEYELKAANVGGADFIAMGFTPKELEQLLELVRKSSQEFEISQRLDALENDMDNIKTFFKGIRTSKRN